MHDVTQQEKTAVEELIIEHAFLNDHHRTDRLFELYASDGKTLLPDGAVMTRDKIRNWGEKRRQDVSQVRHFQANIRVLKDEQGLSAITYYLVFRDSHNDPTHPVSVGEYHDRFVIENGILKFLERKIQPIFSKAGVVSPLDKMAQSNEGDNS